MQLNRTGENGSLTHASTGVNGLLEHLNQKDHNSNSIAESAEVTVM